MRLDYPKIHSEAAKMVLIEIMNILSPTIV